MKKARAFDPDKVHPLYTTQSSGASVVVESVPTLLSNIRLPHKYLPRSNTLAYCAMAFITQQIYFKTFIPIGWRYQSQNLKN